MYGMVNKAIEELIVTRFGAEAWERTKQGAGIDIDLFVSNDSYPDDVTYRMVGAASEVLGVPANDILFAFGEHWISQTARKEYAPLLAAGGRSLREFLINLPNFHARIILIFPKLQPPRFQVSEVTESSLKLHYMTHRPGLSSFVAGIVSGLAEMFATPLTVNHIARKDDGDDHDIFFLQWKPVPVATP